MLHNKQHLGGGEEDYVWPDAKRLGHVTSNLLIHHAVFLHLRAQGELNDVVMYRNATGRWRTNIFNENRVGRIDHPGAEVIAMRSHTPGIIAPDFQSKPFNKERQVDFSGAGEVRILGVVCFCRSHGPDHETCGGRTIGIFSVT
ncbi:hypothetical protein [Pseudomonas sp. No.21]